MNRRHIAALVAGVSLLASACGAGSASDASSVTTGDVPADSSASSEGSAPNGSSSSGGLSSSSNGVGSGASGSSSSTTAAAGGSSGPNGMSSEVAAQASLTLEDAFPPEAEACVLGELATQPDLLADVLTASDFSDLSEDDQATVVSISLGCSEPGIMAEYMVQGFNESSDFDAPPEMGTCFEDEMNGPNGELVILGFIAIGNDLAPSADSRQPLIDTMTKCLPGSLMADVITAGIAEDPTMAGAVDAQCVSDGYDEPGVMESFWTAFIDNPDVDFEDLPADVRADFVRPMVDCISFGAVIAAEASADGVTLSADSIACVDEEIAASGMMETIIAGGEPDANALGAAVLGCLSAAELGELANS